MSAFQLTDRDEDVLSVVHPDLERIIKAAVPESEVPFVVFEGVRTLQRQRRLKAKGASKTLRSRHLTGHAVDLVPLIDDKPVWDRAATIVIAAAVLKAASDLGLRGSIRWGGDWDRDGDYNDERFYDGPHFELERSVYGDGMAARTAAHLRTLGVASPPSQLDTPPSKYDATHKSAFAQEVQRALRKMDIRVNGKLIVVDGHYGEATRHGVRVAQKMLGVPTVDGLWGPVTGEAYNAWRAAMAQRPKAPEPVPVIVPEPKATVTMPTAPAPAPAPAATPESDPTTDRVVADDRSTRPTLERDTALDMADEVYDANPVELPPTNSSSGVQWPDLLTILGVLAAILAAALSKGG